MSCVIISSFKRREIFRTGTSNLLSRTVLSVVCGRLLHTSCVVGLWFVVHGHEPRGKGRASTTNLSLYSITCIPSIVVSAFESCVLRSRSAAALRDRELRHWHKTNNARKVSRSSAIVPLLLGTYIIVIALRGCGTTYIRNASP